MREEEKWEGEVGGRRREGRWGNVGLLVGEVVKCNETSVLHMSYPSPVQ